MLERETCISDPSLLKMKLDFTSMASQATQLPNPYAPMAFFPPELAYQITISSYVAVGSVSALLWDILTNLGSDWKMLRLSRITLSLVAYFISRWAALAYMLGITVVSTAPVRNCDLMHHIQFLFPLLYPCTSLLFFFRIRAMYAGRSWIITFFFFMWLACTAGTTTTSWGVSSSNIGTTDYCYDSRLEPYVFAATIIPTVNDTLVFCAMTWWLMRNSYENPTLNNTCKTFVLGRFLPAFSKALLRDGQAYYLTTIGLNIVTAALFFDKSLPVVYRSFVGVPNVVLMNNMACHVYRNIKLGVYAGWPENKLKSISQVSQPALVVNGSSPQPRTITSVGLDKIGIGHFITGKTMSECRYPVMQPFETSAESAV